MRGELEGFVHDITEHLVGVGVVVRREAEDHFIQKGAETVEVDGVVVTLFFDHLRRHVS